MDSFAFVEKSHKSAGKGAFAVYATGGGAPFFCRFYEVRFGEYTDVL